jgi:transposase-like protein
MTSTNNLPRWLPDREVARVLNISDGTLRNWRSEDMRAGRVWPEPGRGGLRWRRFGRTIRYLVTPELLGETETAAGVEHGADRG